MRARLALPVALLALVLVPSASAFPGGTHVVRIAYDAEDGPLAILSGDLRAEGRVHQALFVADAIGTRLGPIPRLEVAPQGEVLRDVVLTVHEGALVVRPGASNATLDVRAAYGVAIGLASAPFGGESSPGFLLASGALRGDARFAEGSSELVPVDATISLHTSDGAPLPGWDHRRVNTGRGASDFQVADGSVDGVALRATGPYEGLVRAKMLAGAVGVEGALGLRATRAESVRFAEATSALALLGASGGGVVDASGLRQVAGLADVINGGVLLVNTDPTGGAREPRPTLAVVDGRDLDVGGFTLLRAEETRMTWEEGDMRVQADRAVAVSGSGLVATAPATIGPVPVLAVVLWLIAAAALVYYFRNRPPAVEKKFGEWRLAGFLAHAAAFALVFWWWDVQFAETFGTSVLTMLFGGATGADGVSLTFVLALQMLPWGLAALLFALPTRIALGVALRYAGKGKALRGFAKAGGVLALGALGPLYALWLLDFVLERMIAAFPGF